ncbi:energy transducer TonB [Stutzerimonas nosocomialis]|uniref:energy transducer TonB n=1 Tax=Stutzerimonas nosocomialis TaxID=1056496 RepID=UPI00110976D1|nr:energy transducer TonB [Stutzerimonas nosocomialis]TLX59775.1 energy transducer TonB [Stutzerimonas nosocomialis]
MSSLSLRGVALPAVDGAWRSHAAALSLTLGLHLGLFALLLHGGSFESPAPAAPPLLKTQLVSLPRPLPEAAPEPVPATPVVAEAEAEPVPEPRVQAPPEPDVPKVDPQREQRRLEEAALARKRAEQQRQAARERERQAEAERERQAQERLAQAERQRLQAERQAQARAEAAAEQARQAAAAASRQYEPLVKQAPAYPQRALDKGIEGECTVIYTVNTQGRVEDPQVLGECHPLFVRPSLNAAKGFRYQPRVVDGRSVAVAGVKNTFRYRIE